MCLLTVSLNLKKNEDGEFVGVGYKAVYKNDVNTINTEWTVAKVNEDKLSANDFNDYKRDNSSLITSEQGIGYNVGFHIFLDKKDADDYGPRKDWEIYEVEFKNVTCFGENTVYGVSPRECRPCVIAQHIRYLRKI